MTNIHPSELPLRRSSNITNRFNPKKVIEDWYAYAAARYDDHSLRWKKSINKDLLTSITNSNDHFLILDIACGTGIYLSHIEFYLMNNLVNNTNIKIIGLDLSIAMLSKAQQKTSMSKFIQGSAMDLPVASENVDYVSIQTALHLINNKKTFLREVYRVLKTGGIFSIFTHNPWKMNKHWIYTIFPVTSDYDKSRFLTNSELIKSLENIGFSDIQLTEQEILSPVTLEEACDVAENRWSTSQFLALSEQEWRKGLLELRQMSKNHKNSQLWWHEVEVNVSVRKVDRE